MNRTLTLAAVLSVVALAAQAETPDAAGQFATAVSSGATTAQVQSQLAAYKKAGVNPWSISYNPLASFQSQKNRAQVTGEYLASRDAVAAMTGEDSGSAFLASNKVGVDASRQLAGQPARSAQ